MCAKCFPAYPTPRARRWCGITSIPATRNDTDSIKTLPNSVFDWVRHHRIHHNFSDTDAEPHNANRGVHLPRRMADAEENILRCCDVAGESTRATSWPIHWLGSITSKWLAGSTEGTGLSLMDVVVDASGCPLLFLFPSYPVAYVTTPKCLSLLLQLITSMWTYWLEEWKGI